MKKRLLGVFLILVLSISVFSIFYVAATVIFSNGFEEGNFSAWTGTSGSPSIDTDPVHHDTYSMYIDAAEYVYYDFTNTNDAIYARCYVYFTTLPSDQYYKIQFLSFKYQGVGFDFAYAVYAMRTASSWKFELYDGYTSATDTCTTVPETGKWYCVELMGDRNANGNVWIDGNLEATLGTSNVALDQIGVGSIESHEGNCNIDCFVLADAYIGPEAEAGESYEFDLPETAAVTANVYTAKTLSRALTESTTVTSNVYSTKTLTQVVGESLSITTVAEATKGITQVISELFETSTETASLTVGKALFRSLTETPAVTSNLDTLKAMLMSFTETVAVSDSTVSLRALLATLTESLTVSDNSAFLKALTTALGESTSITSIAEGGKSITTVLAELIETANVDSLLSTMKALFVILGDSSTVTSILSSEKSLTQVIAELSETSTETAGLFIQKFLSVVLPESLVPTSVLDITKHMGTTLIELFETASASVLGYFVLPEVALTVEDAIGLVIVFFALSIAVTVSLVYATKRKKQTAPTENLFEFFEF